MSRRRAALSSNGWRARFCPASRRYARNREKGRGPRLQKRGDDRRPFLLERPSRDRLAGASIPITRVGGIALLAVEVGVHPIARAGSVALHEFMRPVPVSLAVMPKRL